MNGLPIADVTTFTLGRDALTNGLLLQMDCRTNGLLLQGGNVANTKNELFTSWCGHNSWGLLKLFWLEPLDSAIWQLHHMMIVS